MGVQELSSLLWLEREALETLLYRIQTQVLHLASRRLRWLKRSTEEIEQALERVRFASLARTIESTAAAEKWKLQGAPTLAGLARTAAEPWDGVLLDHLGALSDLLDQLDAERNSDLRLLEEFSVDLRDAPDGEDPRDLLDAQVQRHNCEHAIRVLAGSHLSVVEDFVATGA